jgi:hypothetical protein
MDQNIATDVSAGATFLCAKSWIAYLWLVLVAAMLMVALPFVYQWNMWAAIAMMAVGWTFIGYNALHTYSQRLYCDHLGVWLQIGFLPWNKGIVGVKWRDIDEATFSQNLFSWIFRSHTIRIGHRFTRSSEIYLPSMSNGKETVVFINTKLMGLIQENQAS